MKLINLKKIHEGKFLTYYVADYLNKDNEIKSYEFISRDKNLTIEYSSCNSDGTSCSTSAKYITDNRGNQIAYYHNCGANANSCQNMDKYEYDSHNNVIAVFNTCDMNGNNCNNNQRYEYDTNDNLIAHNFYYGSTNNRSEVVTYEYDSKGNQTAAYYCDGKGENCKVETNTYTYTDITVPKN